MSFFLGLLVGGHLTFGAHYLKDGEYAEATLAFALAALGIIIFIFVPA